MQEKNTSYKEIVKSTGLIAVVQIVQIVFGLIRNKVVALVLGAKGFGIWGLYNIYIEMTSAFSTLGLDQSGVRQIAKSDDEITVAKCIWIFKRMLIITSASVAMLSMIFSKKISVALFNTEDYHIGVIIVSFIIFCNGISKGQIAILNGLRNLRSLAMSQIIGAITGSVVCITFVYLFGTTGIPLSLLAIGLTAVISTWWYVRKMKLKTVKPVGKEAKKELKQLYSLGLGFSTASIIAAVMTFLSRAFLLRKYDLDVLGIYQASWTISNLYIGTILTAMGIDFMPRIMKIVNNKKMMNKTVNEQIELGVLVSSIGVVTILVFSPLVLHLLYSSEFIIGTNIIRWQVLGVCLRVIAFPFSYIIMAYNKPLIYSIIQAIFWTADFLLLMLFSEFFGFNGLGINYCIAYILYLLFTFVASYKLCGFKFSKFSIRIICISFGYISLAWFVSQFAGQYHYFVGIILIFAVGVWIYVYLQKYMNINLAMLLKSKIYKISKKGTK